MRSPSSEKLEIIRLIENSHLPAKQTLDKLGIPRRTFYRWYDRYLEQGEDGLVDRASHPGRVWNKIPENIRGDLLVMALGISELSAGVGRTVHGYSKAILCLKAQYIAF